MKNLLYKEWKLASHPTIFIFWLLSSMVLIPNYPYYIILFYTMLGIFFVCLNGRENHDLYYGLSLPVQKSDLVRARYAFVIIIEMVQLLVAIPFIVLSQSLHMPPNYVGMDANMAFLGISLMIFGLINWVFLRKYFAAPEKVGKSFAISSIYIGIVIVVVEVLSHVVPFMRDRLDTPDPAFLMEKVIVLILGVIIYALLTMASMGKSIKAFEKLDF